MSWKVIAEGYQGDMTTYINSVPSGTKIKIITQQKLDTGFFSGNCAWGYAGVSECGCWDMAAELWGGEKYVNDPTGGYLRITEVECNDETKGEIHGYVIGDESVDGIGSIGFPFLAIAVISLAFMAVGLLVANVAGLYLVITGELGNALDDIGDIVKWAAIGGSVIVLGIAAIYGIKGFTKGREDTS